MVIEIKMKTIPIISFSIDAIGVSYIIVSIVKFILALINSMTYHTVHFVTPSSHQGFRNQGAPEQ